MMMTRAVLLDAPGGGSAAEECSTSSSSSIGRNSDVSSERSVEGGENEVESAYRGPLHAMETLEEVLPIRRSISKFYNGKSKSFTTLADAASSPSVKDIAKPENAYSRRRRSFMALNHALDKNRSYPLRFSGGGICKRPISLSRSTLAFAVAMNNSESNSSITSEDSGSSSNSIPSSSSLSLLPPLHPRNGVASGAYPSSPSLQNLSSWRSFSLADLQQHCAIAATMKISSTSIGNKTAHPS
ncbi:protein OXIDATIVE STRESS 3 LIKE 2-like [Vigna umbellata]|uniref:protein OXIDATIVE STRESS 3 LIKE 2-like n=1 Tax=Vigna umbellata TaxID=87088 RepID=UPI001F5FBFFA|nr:protein OXIDATIVE STRESS 3 LIKE 2-like [Vigna umbellata]XP_047171407.1 protein OXIDATIVE STRESS 3 LIKE 2-like [Vigna umbellata]